MQRMYSCKALMARSRLKVPYRGTITRPKTRPADLDRARLFDALKRLLRARKVTYAELGRRLRLSESGVKKIFSGEDCSLVRLGQMADAVGFSLGELFEAGARPAIEHVALTHVQQAALLASPLLLA